ncbi:MAG: type 1 glutamine amidotransferase [Bryobacteraceae bacterium]
MHVLVFRHVPFEHLGLIAPALESRDISFEYVDLFLDPAAAIREEAAAGFIFMGGPMSANDDFPYIRREIDLIERAAAAGKPMLGICLGAQLIAKALGAGVYRNPVKEIGWYPIRWSQAASADPLLAGLSGADTVFHWHGETFDLPRGSELLASSERCRNQAFRWGGGAHGFQFHLEVTPEMIADWVRQDLNSGDVRELDSLPDPQENAARLRELSSMVFGRWADVARQRAGV